MSYTHVMTKRPTILELVRKRIKACELSRQKLADMTPGVSKSWIDNLMTNQPRNYGVDQIQAMIDTLDKLERNGMMKSQSA